MALRQHRAGQFRAQLPAPSASSSWEVLREKWVAMGPCRRPFCGSVQGRADGQSQPTMCTIRGPLTRVLFPSVPPRCLARAHLHSVCTTKDTLMPSLSWGLLRGSSLAALISSNFSLNPGKQGAVYTLIGVPSATVSLGQMARSRRHQNVWCWPLSLALPLGAMSLTSFTLASSMITPPVWSAPRLFLNQRAQIPRIHLSCDGDQMMTASASVSSCYRLALLAQNLELPWVPPGVSRQTHWPWGSLMGPF